MEDCSHFTVHHLSAIEKCAEYLEHVYIIYIYIHNV